MIAAGAAAQLTFTTQPGTGTGGSALATQPVVAVQDAGGNTVAADTSSVTLALTDSRRRDADLHQRTRRPP